MSGPPHRRTSGFSTRSDLHYNGRRVDSFQRTAQNPVQTETVKKGYFPVYDLDWAKLKAFIEAKYPGYEFDERRNVQNDKYVWIIPPGEEGLTADDEAKIRELREPSSQGEANTSSSGFQGDSSGNNQGQRHRSLSPET
ncbi:MAG: hypothetical protein MMC23_003580 [Stictis urceolatum]|nr:hypothetical protein [Stictis urceolata]